MVLPAPGGPLSSRPCPPAAAISTARFALSAGDPEATFECSLDDAAFEPCQATPEYDGLSNGGHTFKVRATDALGNVGPASEPFAWTVEVDVTAPEISKTTPANRAKNVALRSAVVVYFSEKVDPASVNTSTVRLLKGARAVPASVTYDGARNRAVIKPKAAYSPKSVYTAVVVGKAGGIKDPAGNPLAANRTWRFTTR